MRAAIVNMKAVFSDVEANLKTAERYIEEAKQEGAAMIVFPEFFTTGFALDERLLEASVKSWDIRKRLAELSRKHDIIIGGSYIYYDRDKREAYNEFGLLFPSGEEYFHKKDIPTALENFCYTGGDNISAFDTPVGRIGIVMCWEQIRWETVKRMAGKVDMIIAGSCWWGFAKEDGFIAYRLLNIVNIKLAKNAPLKLSEIMGVPVLHSSIMGSYEGADMRNKTSGCIRRIVSRTMASDAYGKLIYMDQGMAGYKIVEIEPGCIRERIDIPEGKYWIPKMNLMLEKGFYKLNEAYKKYYEKVSKEKMKKIEKSMVQLQDIMFSK